MFIIIVNGPPFYGFNVQYSTNVLLFYDNQNVLLFTITNHDENLGNQLFLLFLSPLKALKFVSLN
ncbi:hypothetical protein CJF42_13420 [Pseudoalteromonas sp. NBT06-2]|nr:hypothetical protein CJF42_13420 [Pseudoalteromonas sp. NBT06-2]